MKTAAKIIWSAGLICMLIESACSSRHSRLAKNVPLGVLPMNAQSDIIESNNLARIWAVLEDATRDGYRFPTNLLDVMVMFPDMAKLFISPLAGAEPGDPRNIEDWTDYIYFGNATVDIQFEALIISPPQSYDGKYGYVLFVDGIIYKITPEMVKAILKEPWLFDKWSNESVIDATRRRLQLFVPPKYGAFYN